MKTKVHLASLMFAAIFGFSFMFSKIALDYVSPIGLISYRFLVAAIVFEAIRRLKLITIQLKRSQIKALLVVAIFQPFLYFIFEIYGLNLIASSEAGMMIALIPVFVGILSAIILKEKPKPLQIFFILLSVSGILYIQISVYNTNTESSLLGFILVFGAVISAALFNIASRSASRTVKAHELTYFMMIFGAMTFNTIYLAFLLYERRPYDYFLNLLQVELILPIVYLGVMASIVAFFLVNFALSRLEAHVSSIYANLVTIVGIFAGYFILNEALGSYHFIGSAMIIIGVYGTVRSGRGIRKLSIDPPKA